MKLTESKLRQIVKEETRRLISEAEEATDVAQRVFELLDKTRGVNAQMKDRTTVEANGYNMYFTEAGPITLEVEFSGPGVYRTFEFSRTNDVNTPYAILDRIETFIT